MSSVHLDKDVADVGVVSFAEHIDTLEVMVDEVEDVGSATEVLHMYLLVKAVEVDTLGKVE